MVNCSRIIDGATRMMKNPYVIVSPSGRVPEKASIMDLVVLELAAVEKVFRGLPYMFWDFIVFIEAEVGKTVGCGPH